MHHFGPTANSQYPKGTPLGSNRKFTKHQGCTIGVPPRIHRTPKVPKGAQLGFHHEFTKPLGCSIGVPPRIHKTTRVHHWGEFTKPQGVPPRIHKIPRVHHWGLDANSPLGSPLGSRREFTKPQGCSIGVPPRIHRTPRVTKGCTIGVPP